MLTDIFSDRYLQIELWKSVSELDRRFLVQGFRMVSESLFPYWQDGKAYEPNKTHWKNIHDKLSMELGLSELSPKAYAYQTTLMGKPHMNSGTWTLDHVCKNFVCAEYNSSASADRFMKDRISFIELAFREKHEQIHQTNSTYEKRLLEAQIHDKLKKPGGMRIPGSRADAIRSMHDSLNEAFKSQADELNERMRRAGYSLNYHNGFIQISDDSLIEEQIESEFWHLTSGSQWENVDIDMKEALDLRDSGGRDPAFYAARALESTIKIISDLKGLTHGGERGAHSYIDNLTGKRSGPFLSPWESKALKAYFTDVRNPFGHGPGSAEMPSLSSQQTDWAIENAMSWTKTLIKRN